MKRTFPFRKRSLATLVAAAILVFSMFFGIQAMPIVMTGANTSANLVPLNLQQAFPSSSPSTSSSGEKAFSNVASNLMDYLRTGESSSDLRSSNGRPELMITAGLNVNLKELATHMWIRSVYSLGFGYIIQGFVNTAKDLAFISAMSYVGTISGNPYIAYNRETSETPVTDQFRAREIMGIEEAQALYPDFNGTGITIGICDTGTDFGVTDLATAYDTEGGVPTSFDPGGTGIAITSYSLPARRRGGGAGEYLLIADLVFTMFRGEGPAWPTSDLYGFELQDMLVGGIHPIVSKSGYYQIGMSVQNAAGLPGNRAFFIYILVDSTTAGIYDTLYIDFETSFALTAEYNGIGTWVTADWDFTNNAPHRWGDGTEVLAEDFDFDGVNDYSMGMLSNTFDLLGLLTGDLISGILPDGSGFAVMYDYDGHGTGTAGAAAGRGLTGFDVYGNGTLYKVPGAAPGATIMALKLFTWGDYMDTWIWGCGFEPTGYPYGIFSNWTYTGAHKADILSNSWGMLDFLVSDMDMAWGYDWYSQTVDFLSYWTDTLFCIATGNTGPGYGTGSSPYAVSAMMVGASTTAHYAQPRYGKYPQGYDTMADFSSAGPTPLGSGNPSVVAIGAYAFDVYALHYGAGDGLEAWTAFGGTSQACPLAAGVAAIVMQAMDYSGIPYSSYGLTSSIAKTIVMNGADDLGYDVYRQGAGRVNAWKAINMAFGNTTDGTNDLLTLGTMETFDQIFSGGPTGTDRQTGWRAWYINMYYGWEYEFNIFDYISYYHPGYEYGPYAGVWDGAAFPHPMYRGDTYSFYVAASVGTLGAADVDALNAYTYQFTEQASAKLKSTSTYTTFNLTKEFSSSFMTDFYTADYATIMLTYPREKLEQVYSVASAAPYVFLMDWMNDTNGNGAIDLTGIGSVGEVRRIASDTSYSNCHQINLGNPGNLFQKTPALFYHDVGLELFAWRSMDVNVTIRLYDRVSWSWVTTTYDSLASWRVDLDVPSDATPGFYEGFLEATTTTGVTDMPLSIRVDANMDTTGPAGAVSWGGTQGTIYDNGATYGGLNYGYREQTGDWRFYFVDAYPYAWSYPPSGTPSPSYYLVNVTWTDPDTCIDVIFYYSSYGYSLGSSEFEWVGDRASGYWAGSPTGDAQNVMLLGVSRVGASFNNTAWQSTWLSRGLVGIALRTSAFGGHTGGPEDFWVTVSYTNTNHGMYPSSAWASPACWMNVTYPAIYGGQAIVAGSTYTGPAVTFKGNWTQLSIADFPGLKIQQSDLQVNKVSAFAFQGSFVESNCTPGTPYDVGPYDVYYPLPDIPGGARIDAHLYTADPGSPPPDNEFFLVDPTGATVASSTRAEIVAPYHEDIVGYIAAIGGTYQLAVDYGGAQDPIYNHWGGWPVLEFTIAATASLLSHSITTGLASSRDTGAMGNAVGLDVVLKGLTGTSLDSSNFLEHKIPNISVTNRFAPTVQVVHPNGGEVVGPGAVTLNWTGHDRNVDEYPNDEFLTYSVEISNNSGTSWKLVIFSTSLDHGTWNPQSAFYGFPAGSQFLVRVNVTDGVFAASDTSDAVFTVQSGTTTSSTQPPYELYTIIVVAVIVIVILLTTCVLKRRQTSAK
jgi:hypothetical protein